MTFRRTLLALAALAIPAAATAAAPPPQSIVVELGDLNLDTDSGKRILARRIQRAAMAVCKAEALASLPQTIRSERQCLRETQARANAAAKIMTAAGETPHNLDG